MDRSQKVEQIKLLKDVFSSTNIVLLTTYSGLTVAEMQKLRKEAIANNVSVKVLQNNLAKISITDTSFEGLKEHIFGPVAMVYSDDVVAAAKVVNTFAKKNEKLEIISASMNESILSEEEIKTLAQLPSLEELRAKIIGVISAPATKIAGVLQAPAGKLARVLDAYSKKTD